MQSGARRAIDRPVPQGHWQTITFVVGLRHDAMVAPFVINGPMTGASFLAYLAQCLVPNLKRDDIVIIDNSKPIRSPVCVKPSKPRARGSVPAGIFARPRPHRAGLRQAQSPSAQGGRAIRSKPLAPNWLPHPNLQCANYLQACRLCCNMIGNMP